MKITTIHMFHAAHQLHWHPGKCKDLHGHTYKLEVTLQGELNENGIVQDFDEVHKVIGEHVIEKYDHKFLNDIMENPTAEIIAQHIWNDIKDKLPVCKIKLWETTDSFVELEK